jgi:hypothetical protein
MNGFNLLAFFAYLLSVISYATRFPKAFADPRKTLIVGTILLVLGYGFLATNKALSFNSKLDTFDDETKKKKKQILMLIGFGLLAIMFMFSFVIPLNFVVRFYDPFAAIGYSFLFLGTLLPKMVPIKIGQSIILIYYLIGGLFKIGDTELPEIGLMISRLLLALYNGAAIFLGH